VRPACLADAYAISDRLAERLGWPVAGWYCACTNRDIQRLLGLDEPYYARLFARLVHSSPVTLAAQAFPPIVIECEIGFRLAEDLPQRAAAYRRDEVADAIAAVHPCIEVVAGHLADWPSQDVFSVVADNGTDGALVVGDGVAAWRGIDLVSLPVTLSVNGERVREGRGARVLGDPLAAFVWLVNARATDGEGLRAGDVHNTGTATAICRLAGGDHAVADFGALGVAAVTLI
jgi:2-keto-4-pentenoate hydratase